MKFSEVASAYIHDVKNQLFALSSRAEQAGDRDMLAGLQQAATTLTQLLTLYKRESGAYALDIQDHSPADLVDELAAGARSLTGLEVAVDSRAAPSFWYYDEPLVRLALHDAVHNALRSARAHITLVALERDDMLVLQVRDDGPGYPDALLSALADNAPVASSAPGGTGLGLHLSQDIATAHQNAGRTGRLELHNDGGAVFSLCLPR